MPVALDLLLRECVMLVTLFALGVGPASWLSDRLDPVARAALAPALGLSLGTSLFTTLIAFAPSSRTFWLLPVVGLASAGYAFLRRDVWRHRGGSPSLSRWKSSLKGAAEIVLVCLAVSTPINVALLSHNSIGPAAYSIADVDGYVLQTDGMMHESFLAARSVSPNDVSLGRNLVRRFLSVAANSNGWPFEASALEANFDSLLQIGATQSIGAVVLVYLVVAGLGAFAAVRYATWSRSPAALLAGALFGGPFFFQLYFDGSVAAICAMAVLVPLGVVSWDALGTPSRARLVLVSLVVAPLPAFYPVFIAPVSIAAVIVAGVAMARVARREVVRRARAVGMLMLQFAGVVALAAAFDVLGTLKGFTMFLHQAGKLGPGAPSYDLGWGTAGAWLLQARGIYSVAFSDHTLLSNALLGVAVPVALGVCAIFGVIRWRFAWVLLPLMVVSIVLAIYTRSFEVGSACTYCTDRSLLPVGTVAPVLLALGVAGIAASGRLIVRAVVLPVVLIAIGAAAHALVGEETQFSSNSYFVGAPLRSVIAHLPKHGCVVLEGFTGANPLPPAEAVLPYAAGEERAWGRIGLPVDYDAGALEYLALPAGLTLSYPSFCAGYRYVLTRMDGTFTRRRIIFRDGAIAVEDRARPLGLLVDHGVWLGPGQSRPYVVSSIAATSEPTEFVVTGVRSWPVYVRLSLGLGSPGGVGGMTSPEPMTAHRRGEHLDICIRSRRVGPGVGTASLHMTSGSDAQLDSMVATSGSCSVR